MAIIGATVVLTLTTLCQLVGSLTPQVKHVHPFNSSTECISEPCTFDQYADDPEQHFLSNVTFLFFPGNHQLNSSIYLHDIQNITFQGMLTEGSVTVRLGPQVGLNFSNCDGIEISSLKFLLSGDYEYRLMFHNTGSANLLSIMISAEDEKSITTRGSAILSQASVMNICDSSFVGISGQFGAALRLLDSSEITFVGTNNFTNNAAKLGGAIYSTSSTLQFDGISIFIDNAALSNDTPARNDTAHIYSDESDIPFDSGIGGAVYANNSQFTLSGCAQFLTNNATNLGGAVAAVNGSVVVINGSLCSNNDSSPIGIVFDSNCVNTEAEFPFNAIGSGGALYVGNSEADITNISLLNNFSPMHGGAAYFVKTNVSLVNIIIATNNTANKLYGGAIRFYLCTQVHIKGENSFKNNYARSYGGAIDFCDVRSLNIAGVNFFEGNTALNGGAFDVFNTQTTLIGGNITFKQNGDTSNAGTSSGGAVYVFSSTVHFTGNMKCENNSAGDGGALSSYFYSQINFYANVLFLNNHANSFGGAIYCSFSRIIFYGNETNKLQQSISNRHKFRFESNTANYGGAIAMYGNVKLTLNPNVEIIFIENQANFYGGAIFVDIFTSSECLAEIADTRPECFIQLNTCYSSFIDNSNQFLLNFTNNDAGERGNVLYGGWLNECRRLFKTNAECGTSMNGEPAFEIVKNISGMPREYDEFFTFSSKPNSLCIYNESFVDHCVPPMPISISPGEIFNVSLLTIDQYSNPINGVEVMSNQINTGDYRIDHNHTDTIMTNSSLLQNLFYQIFVHNDSLVENESELKFSLYVDLDGQCRNSTHFNITVKPCPLGFEFSSDIRKCNCAQLLKKYTEDCIIEDITLGRSSNTVWINHTTDYILLHDGGCPLDYCSHTKVYVPRNKSDIQCSDGRTGKLCGNCTENYSLALGNLKCKPNCSHTSLLLSLPIGALGILLIVLLFLLRLTVAAGTINGLLFYANIVQANHQIFLPTLTTKLKPLTYFYTIFLGWLNLDFGIETCFYDGMDIIAYSWLQFLFPVYLWVLMFIIILSAHYSQRVAQSLGHNPVAVLATVLLISYGKMLKAIIVPLSWAKLQRITLENSNISNDTEIVWLYNGNIPYSDHHHIILVVFASLVLLFLFLPYSFLLLCGHLLQAKSHWRALSWINKLKPFMDAYHGPYKKNDRHWIGLFLLARCSLFLTFVLDATGLGDQNLNLLIITSVTTILSIIKGRVYEKWYNDFLESSFLLNLCILSVATFYVQSKKSFTDNPQKIIDNQIIVSSVSVGIAFIFFIGIMVFHTHQQMKEVDLSSFFQGVRRRYRLRLKKQSNKTADKEQSMEMITKSSICLRELLLDDETQT